jgi:hypothetical protein
MKCDRFLERHKQPKPIHEERDNSPGGMAQVVGHRPSKCEALHSNSNTAKK